MIRIGLFEARQKLSQLVQRAAAGAERARAANRHIVARRKRPAPVTLGEIRRWIGEGRK